MENTVPIGKTLSIRECGYDEYWLQDQIASNPACLQLGDLELVARERLQSSGGRLDILLKDPEDDSMYEVEIMLGDTDETHIIRTIEYWIREKRKWPSRQHFPVLVAEAMTRRFFDVIQVISHAIPLIAIQANIVEVAGNRALTFQKILAEYEEPEDTTSSEYEPHDEAYWLEKASWTAETAKTLLEIVRPVFPEADLRYVKNYISIAINRNLYFWFHKRAGSRSLLTFWVADRFVEQVKAMFDEAGISYAFRKDQTLRVTIDKSQVEKNAALYLRLATIIKESWAG